MDVLVNAAMSLDGKLSTVDRRQVRISGQEDFTRVDRLRASHDAVMVGVGTVLADDPHLTVKDASLQKERDQTSGSPHPTRIVADSHLRTPIDASVLDEAAPTYLLTTESATASERRYPSETRILRVGQERVDLTRAFDRLGEAGMTSIMVEGGGELIFSLARDNLIDRLSVFVGSNLIGGRDAPTLADGTGFREESEFQSFELEDVEQMDDGLVLWYRASNR